MNPADQKKRKLKDELPINDELFLSPIQKYKIYGKFPWKLVIHFLLVIGTSFQVLIQMSTTNPYSRGQERKFYEAFISDSDKTQLDWARTKYLLSVPSFIDHIKSSIANYHSFTKGSLEDIQYYPQTIDQPDVNMKVSYIKSISDSGPDMKSIFLLKADDLGPLELGDKKTPNKAFISLIEAMYLNYTFTVKVPNHFGDHCNCFIWDVQQEYSFNQRAHVVVSLNINRETCANSNSIGSTVIAQYVWLHICVFVLATISLILLVRYFYNMFKLYWKVKTKLRYTLTEAQLESLGFDVKEKSLSEFDKLKLNYSNSNSSNGNGASNANANANQIHQQKKEKKKNPFLNLWTVLTLIGNVIQIAGSGMSIFDKNNSMFLNDFLIGLSCVFSLLSIGRYFQNLKHYSIIFNSIQLSLPTAMRYLIGVIPLFLGFTQFSICVFWRSERFVSTSKAIGTLYAIFNGDAMYDIIIDLKRTSYIIGQLFAYVFCLFFIMVVMNVFLSIIGEAYVRGKMANHNHWIYSYNKLDKEQELQRNKEKQQEEMDQKFISDFKLIELNELNQEQENDMNELKDRIKSMQKSLDEQIKLSGKVFALKKEKAVEMYMHKQLIKMRKEFSTLKEEEKDMSIDNSIGNGNINDNGDDSMNIVIE